MQIHPDEAQLWTDPSSDYVGVSLSKVALHPSLTMNISREHSLFVRHDRPQSAETSSINELKAEQRERQPSSLESQSR
jgi:hypothetical protein